VSWPDASGWKLDLTHRRLYVRGVGHLRIRVPGRVRGTPRTLTVRRRGRAFDMTVFCSQVEPEALPPTGQHVGLDRGVAVLAATSDGGLEPNPRPRRARAEALADAQRDLARRRPASVRHRRAKERIAALGHREANVRKNACHQLSRRLVNGYDLICLEKLRITNMTRSARGSLEAPGTNVAAKAGLNDAILDSGWAMLERFIAYKAADAGRQVEHVDPRHTSVTCSQEGCGHVDPASRRGVVFCCTRCGHTDHADVNAAINILRAGHARHLGAKPGQLAQRELICVEP
jgi:putative transposase